MFNLKGTTHRRGFLGSLASGAAAVGLASMGGVMKLGAEPMPPYYGTMAEDFENWLGKIKGKHKQVFDSPFPDGGLPMAFVRVFQMTNVNVGVPEGDICAVLVLRHDSIPFAFPDAIWAKYKFGEVFKIHDEATKAPMERNAFYNAKPGSLPLPGMAVDELLKSGALIGVCDMAMKHFSMEAGKKMNMDAAEIKKDLDANVLPGIQVLPSGVLAVNRAQERGCTYCFAG
jgi:intracellular sulfur oxidation DsrE/DsrF family protein